MRSRNDPKKLPDQGLIILLTYLSHAYPKGISASRMVDTLVKSIIEGAVLLTYPLAEKATSRLYGYTQEKEKAVAELKGEWDLVDRPDKVMRVISV